METSKMISFSARFINFMTIAMFFATATFKLNAQCGTVSSSYTVSNNTTCTSLTITNGTYTINSGVTLTVGTITIANGGKLVIKGNLTVTDNGSNGVAFLAQNGSQISATSGALIVVGPSNNVATHTVVQFNNGSEFNTLATNATMIVNGSLSNQNNSDNIKVDGNIIINGNLSGGNGSKITGSGSLQTSGSTTLSGSASVFNSTSSCASGPCGYPTSSCTQSVGTPSSSVSSVSCGSGSVTLTSGSVSGGSGTISYQWQSSTATNGWTNISGATNSTYNVSSLSTTTNFRVRVTRNSCIVNSNLVKVTVTGTVTPTVSLASNSGTAICSGASVTFTATASNTGSGTTTYTFYKNNVSVQSGSSNTFSTSTISDGDIFTANISISGGSCRTSNNATSSNISIGVTSRPSATIAYSGSPFCSSASQVTVTRTGSTGGTYSANAGLSIDPNTGTITPSSSTQGTYTVTYTMAASGACTVQTATTTISTYTTPTISSVTSAQPVICPNLSDGTITVNATGTNMEYSSNGGTSFQTSNVFSGLSNGTYNIRVRNSLATSCSVNNSSSIVFNNTCLDPTKCYNILSYNSSKIIETENNSSVSGANLVQKTYTSGPHQQWKLNQVGSYYEIRNVNSGLSAEIAGGTSTWETFITQNTYSGAGYQQWNIVNSSGLYNIINKQTGLYWDVRWGSTDDGINLIQWGDNGGNNQKWNIVEVACAVSCNTSTNATITPSTSSVCPNTSFTMSVPDGGTDVTYAWMGTGLSSSTTRNTSATIATSGTYTYTAVVKNVNGCSNSSTTTITVQSSPSITTQPSVGAQTICSGSTTTDLSVTASGSGISYQWYKNTTASNSNGTLVTGATSASFTPSSSTTGTAYYYCIISGSCSAVTSNVSGAITINPLPTISSISSANRCGTGVLNLGATPSVGSVQWYTTSTGGSAIYTGNSYTTPALNVSTTYYVGAIDNGCVSASRAAVVAFVNPSITNNTIGSDEQICIGITPSTMTPTAIISGGNGFYTYQWQSSSNNSSFSNISGATSATYTPSSLSANTWYSRVVTSGGCQSTSNAVSKQINTGSYTWTGRTSNSWNTTSNWCGNAVPTASDNVTISSGTSNNPIISAITANVKNIEIGTGASLSMANGATLNVAGNWTGTGTFIANDGTNVKFTAASGTQTIAGNSIQYFYNLEKTGASTLSIASGTDLTIRRGGVLKITAGTFDMNSRTVLLKSKIAADGTDSTASLGVVSGTISNASNFKVERYNSAVRGIRYIASPVRDLTAAAFKDSVIIAGPVASGFDAPNTSISTIKEYVESRTSSLSKCFVSFTSINTNIAPGKGYYLFVPGKRTTVYPAAEAVTLVMKGSPVTGNVSFNVGYTATASQGWNLVGNPYPSAIDWDHASWTKAHMDAALYMWNPTTATYYAYVSGISSDGRDNGGIIPSGQGFFVKANAASPVLSVTENAKVNTNTFAKANFRVAQTASYITLKVSNQNGDVDYTTVRFDDGSGNNLSALKMLNTKINIYTKDASKTISYAINAIQNVPAFEVPIYMESPSATVFNVEVIKIVGDMNTGGALKIKDQATGVMTDIAVGTKLSIVPDGNAQRISLVRVAQEAVVTDVSDVEVEGGYELYPTHIHNEQHPVLYTYDNFEKKIEVYNASGHKVASHTTHHSHYSFDDFGKHEAGGIYTIKVSANHKTHVFKVMK